MAMELGEWPNSGFRRVSMDSHDSHDSHDFQQRPRPAPHKSKLPSGYRLSLVVGAGGCLLVFTLNLGLAIWSQVLTMSSGEGMDRRVVKVGDCDEIRSLNTVLHLAINVLSTMLLATSNYGMQCLSAPTRADVDWVHGKNMWLDIGVPSVRNLWRLPRKRVLLWRYNSVFFSSLEPVDYSVWSVRTAHPHNGTAIFAPGANTNLSGFEEFRKLDAAGQLQNLTNRDCISRYATSFQTSSSSVLVVFDGAEPSTPVLRTTATFDLANIATIYSWLCSGLDMTSDDMCRAQVPDLKQHSDEWAPFAGDRSAAYCFSQPVSKVCRLNISPLLVVFVLVANALKAAILLYMAIRPPDEALLVLGDAVESFLKRPYAFSSDSCLASFDLVRRKAWSGPRKWSSVRRRRAAAVSRRRWIFSALLFIIIFAAAVCSLIVGIDNLTGPKDVATLWNLGFGAVSEVAIISRAPLETTDAFDMTHAALMANSPQLALWVLYFQGNALFTAMLAAREWSEFARSRAGLRVSSDPRGEQRSRYFLQLPYRWGIPMLLVSILAHWLVSQSLFALAVDYGNAEEKGLLSLCGYSPVALMAVVVLLAGMGLAVVITGLLRLPTAMPVVGSCSLAMAAACHPADEPAAPDEPLVPLRWGVMSLPEDDSYVFGLGHCGFSGGYVEEPQVGKKYA